MTGPDTSAVAAAPLATIEVVTTIRPIPRAAVIELAEVAGHTICVRKGEFHPGALAVWIRPGSVVPATKEFLFLKDRNYVVKRATFFGEVSDGLLVSLSALASGSPREVGANVTSVLGVRAYDKARDRKGVRWLGPADYYPFMVGVFFLGGVLGLPLTFNFLLRPNWPAMFPEGTSYFSLVFPSLVGCAVYAFAHTKKLQFSIVRLGVGLALLYFLFLRNWAEHAGNVRGFIVPGGVLGFAIMFWAGWVGVATGRYLGIGDAFVQPEEKEKPKRKPATERREAGRSTAATQPGIARERERQDRPRAEVVECPSCGTIIGPDEAKCPKCGWQ